MELQNSELSAMKVSEKVESEGAEITPPYRRVITWAGTATSVSHGQCHPFKISSHHFAKVLAFPRL